jgi:hypothetical protein
VATEASRNGTSCQAMSVRIAPASWARSTRTRSRSRRFVSASSGANPHWPTTASLTATLTARIRTNTAANSHNAVHGSALPRSRVLEVSGGHTLDALEYILGSHLTGVSARLSVQRPTYTVEETGATIPVTRGVSGRLVLRVL